MGRRTRRVVNGGTTDFLYDGLNPVQELSGGTVCAVSAPSYARARGRREDRVLGDRPARQSQAETPEKPGCRAIDRPTLVTHRTSLATVQRPDRPQAFRRGVSATDRPTPAQPPIEWTTGRSTRPPLTTDRPIEVRYATRATDRVLRVARQSGDRPLGRS